MRIKRYIPLFFAGILLTGCAIFPKEEELQRTPIIQAYEQDEFKMAEVKKGTLQLYNTIDAVCMNLGESRYSFGVSNLSYKGVYVSLGEKVAAGTTLAELETSYTDTDVADSSQVILKAKEDSRVTYVAEAEDGEKSVAGQLVVVTNSNDAFYLNAYTEYWDKFKSGDTVTMHIAGEDYNAEVIDASEIGLENPTQEEGAQGAVYFKVQQDGLYLKSQDIGTVTVLIEEKKDVLYVPKSAITEVNGKEIVYVENEDGIRSVQYIETGLHADNKVEIKDGLKLGDKVILE